MTAAVVVRETMLGVVICFAQIPESIAFALMAHVRPPVALHSAWIVGLICGLFGGRPGMVNGATGAFAAVIATFLPAPSAPGANSAAIELLFPSVMCGGVLMLGSVCPVGPATMLLLCGARVTAARGGALGGGDDAGGGFLQIDGWLSFSCPPAAAVAAAGARAVATTATADALLPLLLLRVRLDAALEARHAAARGGGHGGHGGGDRGSGAGAEGDGGGALGLQVSPPFLYRLQTPYLTRDLTFS